MSRSVERDGCQFFYVFACATTLDAIERFRGAHKILAIKFPTFNVSYFLITKSSAKDIPDLLDRKARDIEQYTKNLLPTVTDCKFHFIGARGLIELATKPPQTEFSLKCVDSMPSAKGGYVAFVKLSDYFQFITENGELIDHLFESNVRDYQGDITVNQGIRETLSQPSNQEDFWWLNNGITILASKTGGDLKDLKIRDPQIVNGLQTSQEIFEYFRGGKASGGDERIVLVRIIDSTYTETQDKVIRATNSQTSIPPASLYATDPIHRDIEKLLPRCGLFYDRRKNYWRNKDIQLSKIVGITELAQSVIAILLQEPDMARARPARYFEKKDKKKTLYKKVFSKTHPIDLYTACAMLRKKVEAYLQRVESERRHRNNVLFYVLTTVACLRTKSAKPKSKQIAKIDANQVSDGLLSEAFDIVWHIYDSCGLTDKAAKGPEMARRLKEELQTRFGDK